MPTADNEIVSRRTRIKEAADELFRRRAAGEQLSDDQYLYAHSDLMPELGEELKKLPFVDQDCKNTENPPTTVSLAGAESDGSCAPPTPISTAPINIPDYELLHPIGRGGFGEVWLCRNRHERHFYAAKLIHKSKAIDLEGIREYKMRAEGNPNLVHILHVGEANEFYYCIMPLADDSNMPAPVRDPSRYQPMTLAKYIRRNSSLPPHEVLAVAKQLLDALEHLHLAGAGHYDVKPANVLLMGGTWRLGDHGLMRSSDLKPGKRGTYGFWPPEGVRDHTADLYALGKSLYLLLTGAKLDRFSEFASGQLRSPGDVPLAEGLRKIILRACHVEPSERFVSAREMRSAIDELASTDVKPRPRGSWWLGILASAAVLMVAGVSVYMTIFLVERNKYFSNGSNPTQQERGTNDQLAGRGNRAGNSEGAPGASNSQTRATGPGIVSMEIEFLRGNPAESVGKIGRDNTIANFIAAVFNDFVRVEVELNEPAFCFLIAFNPDGKDQLCFPEGENGRSEPPSAAATLSFPNDPGKGFQLNDGIGLQAFALVASRKPLPSYSQWKAQAGEFIWGQDTTEGAWRYDGKRLDPLGVERGSVKDLPGRKLFADLCRSLADRPGVDAIQAVAFPVKEREHSRPGGLASPGASPHEPSVPHER